MADNQTKKANKCSPKSALETHIFLVLFVSVPFLILMIAIYIAVIFSSGKAVFCKDFCAKVALFTGSNGFHGSSLSVSPITGPPTKATTRVKKLPHSTRSTKRVRRTTRKRITRKTTKKTKKSFRTTTKNRITTKTPTEKRTTSKAATTREPTKSTSKSVTPSTGKETSTTKSTTSSTKPTKHSTKPTEKSTNATEVKIFTTKPTTDTTQITTNTKDSTTDTTGSTTDTIQPTTNTTELTTDTTELTTEITESTTEATYDAIYPFMAAVILKGGTRNSEDLPLLLGMGVVLGDSFVLTPAVTFSSFKKNALTVRVGSNYWTKGGDVYDVKHVHFSPEPDLAKMALIVIDGKYDQKLTEIAKINITAKRVNSEHSCLIAWPYNDRLLDKYKDRDVIYTATPLRSTIIANNRTNLSAFNSHPKLCTIDVGGVLVYQNKTSFYALQVDGDCRNQLLRPRRVSRYFVTMDQCIPWLKTYISDLPVW